VHRADPFTRIASFADPDQDRAAVIAARLGLLMHSEQTIAWVHEKPRMRRRLAEQGIDDTPFALVSSPDELRAFIREHGFPCIAKPAVGAGSIGIRRIAGDADVEAAFATAGIRSEMSGGGVLVERLHEGPQFSAEAFSEDGVHQVVCITRKYSEPRHYVEVGHVLPADLPAADCAAIEAYVARVLDALEIGFGPTHTEFVLTAGGPRIIETHARIAGDRIPYMIHDALGIDLVAHTVRQVLGERELPAVRAELAAARAAAPRCAAIWFAGSPAAGTLESVGGVEQVRAREGSSEVRVMQPLGQRFRPLSSSESRLGLVRTHGASADEALARARDGAAALEFRVLLDTGFGSDLL
jgi:biotin carboxylase